MAGKAAALRKTGLKAHALYFIGGALALLNLLWFGRWMIEKAGAFPDQAAFWGYTAMCVSAAGLYLTRPVFGFIRLHRDVPVWFFLGMIGGGGLYLVRGLQLGFIDPAQLVTRYALPIAVLAGVFAFIAGAIKNRGQGGGLPDFGAAVRDYGIIAAILAAVAVLIFAAPSPLVYMAAAVFVPVLIFTAPVTFFAGKEYFKEAPFYRERLGSTGSGGAARFGGFYWFTKLDKENFGGRPQGARHYVGNTTFETDPRIGGREIYLDTDNHLMTVAAIGAGKSYYSAWNVLPEWKGGVFILDPKGEHAANMAGARQKFGRTILFDPWGLQTDQSATFNPLEEIDIESPNARDDLMQIVKACVYTAEKESGTSAHFRESAETLFLGIMAHVLTTRPKEYHNLPSIYDTFLMGDADHGAAAPNDFDELITDMAMNAAMGKAPMEAAKIMMAAGDRERGAVITTLNRHLKWVNTPSIRPVLMKSSFRMREIKRDRASVFCIVPMEHLSHHARLMRTIIALGLLSCREAVTHNERALFLLDEFAQLGTFLPVKSGLVTMRSWGLKIWMFFQDIGQLRELYDNSDSFLNSCDKQFFGITSFETAKLVSDMCGNYLERWTEGAEEAPRYQERERNLRSPADIQEELRKESGLQYIFPANTSAPLRLKLVPFKYRHGKRPAFNPEKRTARTAEQIAADRQGELERSRAAMRAAELETKFVPAITPEDYATFSTELKELKPDAIIPPLEELKATAKANRIKGLYDLISRNGTRAEYIEELNELGETVTVRYRPKNGETKPEEPDAERDEKVAYWFERVSDLETREEAITELNKLGETVNITHKAKQPQSGGMSEEEVKRRVAEARAEMAAGDHTALDDEIIREDLELYMYDADYSGFYERHGDSLSVEELEQLQAHMTRQAEEKDD